MDSPSPSPPAEAPPGRAWPWPVALAVGGAALAILPHLVRAATAGDATYIADGDALLYLAWSRDVVRRGALEMTDAVHRPSGPMMHPWLLFVPPGLVAHALGLGMTALAILWRVLAGPAVALGLYAVVRPFARSPRAATGLAAFLLFDAGLLVGEVIQREGKILASLARGSGDFLAGVPQLMPHLRVPTPALALPFFLAHLALTHRARRLGTTWAAIAAGASLGLLYHVYFYFATAASLATALAWLLDRPARRTYTRMLLVGAAVAAPAVIVGAILKASTPPDWLVRTGKFAPVARWDPNYLIRPRLLIVAWLAAAPIVFRSRRDLFYLWACTGAGLGLVNQHILTGLNLEDFHWSYAYGTAFSLLLVLLVLPWLGRSRAWRWAAPAIVAAQAAIGSGLRWIEATDSRESRQYLAMLDAWRGEGFAIPPGSVVAAPPDLLLLLGAVEDIDPLGGRLVDFSARTTDEERDRRDALDLALIGSTPDEVEAEIVAALQINGARRDPLRALTRSYEADPGPEADAFRVAYIVTSRGRRPPPALGGRARLEKPGRTWDLWRLGPPAPGGTRG